MATKQEGAQADPGPDDASQDGADLDARARFFDAAESSTEYLSTTIGDARMLVKTEDKHVGRSIFIKQGRGDIKVLGRCVLTLRALLGVKTIAGRTFVDVGANIGTTTITALTAHAFGRALAIEPEPQNFNTLRLNLILNGLDDRVTALQAAASNVIGDLDLVVDPARSGMHWIATSKKSLSLKTESESVISVPTVTLDSLVNSGTLDPKSVGLVWIDAENHEGQILEGASKLLQLGVPIIFEWDPPGLKLRGAPETIQNVVGEHYTHFVDMRRSPRTRAQLRTVDQLEDYVHPVDTPDEDHHFTEVLVLRLTEKQVSVAERAIKNERDRSARIDRKRRDETARIEAMREAAAAAEALAAKERQRIERELAAMEKEKKKARARPGERS